MIVSLKKKSLQQAAPVIGQNGQCTLGMCWLKYMSEGMKSKINKPKNFSVTQANLQFDSGPLAKFLIKKLLSELNREGFIYSETLTPVH